MVEPFESSRRDISLWNEGVLSGMKAAWLSVFHSNTVQAHSNSPLVT